LRPLELNAKPKPPHREFAERVRACAGANGTPLSECGPLSFDPGGFGLKETIELGVVRQLTRLDQAGVNSWRRPFSARS
jgi:hypothetical protein